MHVVLDLDETLVSLVTKPVKGRKYDFKFNIDNNVYYGKKRPSLSLFLKYLFKKFQTVSVWTAATRPYAIKVLDNILTTEQKNRLSFFLTREHLHTKLNGTYTKPLSYIFSNNKLGIKPSNTIIIDDRESAMADNVGNAIIIPQWKGEGRDTYLAKLMIIMDGILKYRSHISFGNHQNVIKLSELTD